MTNHAITEKDESNRMDRVVKMERDQGSGMLKAFQAPTIQFQEQGEMDQVRKIEISRLIERKLIQIVQRYRSGVVHFDLSAGIFDASSEIDSLDLAEVFSWVEQQYGVSPVDLSSQNLVTWQDLVNWLDQSQTFQA